VERSSVDAGGSFEALIGVGFCLGPLLGLASRTAAVAVPASHAPTAALIGGALLLAAAGALRPYLAARRARGSSTR
jgi:hypothetical protein